MRTVDFIGLSFDETGALQPHLSEMVRSSSLEELAAWTGAYLSDALPGWSGHLALMPEKAGNWRVFRLPGAEREVWDADHPSLAELQNLTNFGPHRLEGPPNPPPGGAAGDWALPLFSSGGELRGGLLLSLPEEIKLSPGLAAGLKLHAALLSLLLERLQLERRLLQLQEELGQLESLKGSFMSTVSHELKTPLTNILGFASLAREQAGLADHPELRQFLDGIHDSALHLQQLINEVLIMAGIATAEISLDLQIIDFADLMREFRARRLPRLAGEDRVRFAAELPNAQVRVDEDQFHRILENLLKNALKFSPPESPVEVSWQLVRGRRRSDASDFLRVSVKDGGAGISEAQQERIFDRFYQVDGSDSREHGGTGLGLSVARELSEAMGGKLWVRSAAGEGSTFSFTVPLPRLGSPPRAGA